AKERLLEQVVESLARLILRVNPKTTIDTVSYKLVSAGLSRRVSPSAFLALKAACPIGHGLLGIALGSAAGPLVGFMIVMALGAVGFIGPDFIVNSRIKS